MKNSIKRIIAAILLMAMTLTGIINTFALAEEIDIIEATPAEFEAAIEEEIVAASVDEAVEEADMSLTEDGISELTEEEAALEEVFEETEEADLGELTGEAEAETEAVIEDEDKHQLMADLITMAVEDTKDQGISAALNATFATLADNAACLANPETGVIEVNGPEIISFTYSVVQDNFDTTSEETMGAIEAATSRASDAGYLDDLGGDPDLTDMAVEEKEAEEIIDTAKALFRETVETGIDMLGDVHPAFKILAPLMKLMITPIYGPQKNEDPHKILLAKLDEIEEKLDDMEQDLKDHMENVVVLADLGGKTGTVAENAEVLRRRVTDIKDNDKLSAAQKQAELAALRKDTIVTDLEKSLVGASYAFQGETTITLGNVSVFDAAYRRACEEVMFSGEALDAIAPYIARQMVYFFEGYTLLGEVYDAYEAVYGAASLSGTRSAMYEDMSGAKSPVRLCERFFDMSRYIFVNKSNSTRIQLRNKLYTVVNMDKTMYRENDNNFPTKSPNYMKNNPLSEDQVKSLAKYCADKKTTLFNFLINRMKFTPYIPSSLFDGKDGACPFWIGMSFVNGRPVSGFKPEGANVDSNHIYLASGAQSWWLKQSTSCGWTNAPRYACMKATKATEVGAVSKDIEVCSDKDSVPNVTMFFFEKG